MNIYVESKFPSTFELNYQSIFNPRDKQTEQIMSLS
jgi:hypothetical protein